MGGSSLVVVEVAEVGHTWRWDTHERAPEARNSESEASGAGYAVGQEGGGRYDGDCGDKVKSKR
jgi:hypothetical protein